MLHKETVSSTTLDLIKTLQRDPELNDFILVGGTGLSLQIGHRMSVDIDFFTRNEFNSQELHDHLEHKYGFKEQYRHRNTLKGIIDGVFVDFIRHDYILLENPVIEEGIKISSKADIAAMKVNAIAGNGTRVKDFIDIYFLLKEYSLLEIIGFYKRKYQSNNDFHAMKSLVFFDDIVVEEWPKMILEKELTLKKLKKSILEKKALYLKNQNKP
jgi:hypothetical protein